MIFFTFRTFDKDGGGAIRMKGILNALAEKDKEVILISNANDYSGFHKNIRHIKLNMILSKNQKRLFQFMISICPIICINLFFKKYLLYIQKLFINNKINVSKIIFFESLDNTFAYFLKKNNVIESYINDTHGIAPLEFKYKINKSLLNRIVNYIKYKTSILHDKKTIGNSYGLIFVSQAMQKYFEDNYPNELKNKKKYIVRDGVSSKLCKSKVDVKLLEQIKNKYKLSNKDKIIFFAGAFKDLGGVSDLVKAFNIVMKKYSNIKLFLIGEGEETKYIKKYLKTQGLSQYVILAGLVPYENLRTYQEIADIIVCPDRWHPYSEIVPHIKYYDSLVSGKVVINGKFKCIEEINVGGKLSIDFEPSNVEDLANKILLVLSHPIKLYNDPKIICEKYSYNKNIENLYKE